MRRRDLLALGTLAVAGAASTSASAGGGGGGKDAKPEEGLSLNIAGVGLPIIVGGRIRNYVFVTVKLHLGPGQTAEMLRLKEPFFRDALVKAAHATPFVLADDWTQVDAAAVSAMLMRAAPAISGAGSVTKAEVALQAPRRRTGMRRG